MKAARVHCPDCELYRRLYRERNRSCTAKVCICAKHET